MKRLLFYISLILIIFIVVVVNLSTTNFRGEIGVQEQEYYADDQTPESRQYDGNHKLTSIKTYTRGQGDLPPQGMTIVNNNVYFALNKTVDNNQSSRILSWPLNNSSSGFTERVELTENLWHANDFAYNPNGKILLVATGNKNIGLYVAKLNNQGGIVKSSNYPNPSNAKFSYSGVAYNSDQNYYIGFRSGTFFSFNLNSDLEPINEKKLFAVKTQKENGQDLTTQGIAYRYNHVYLVFSDLNKENNDGNIGKNYIRKYQITGEPEQPHEGKQYSLFPKASNNSTLSTATQESDYLNELEDIEFTDDGKMILIYNLHEYDSNGQKSMKIGFYAMDRDFEQDIIDDDNTAPTISSITGNPANWTNSNVTLTINAIDYGSGIVAYSFDGGSSWQTSNQKTFSANSTVNIQVKDKAGNVASSTVTINKIDKTQPTISSITGNPTSWTNGGVTLTVNATDSQSGIKEYSFDGGNSWQTSNQKIFGANATVNIQVKDNVGNISTTSTVTINKIDKTQPTISSITGNPTSWTNGGVTLTVNATDSQSGIKEYSFDGGNSWQTSNQKIFGANATVNIQVKDNVGNISTTSTVTINKIDKTQPTISSITGNPTSWTNGNVTLTVNAADSQSGIKEYSFDGGNSWQTSNQKTFSVNSTVNIQVKDDVGNTSTSNSVVINKIDKTKPIIKTVTGVPTSITREDVTLTIDAVDNESGVASYSFDGGTTWQTSNRKTYSENTSNIVIKVKDSVGNIETYGTTINITQIDRTDPNQGQENNNNNTNQNPDPNQGQENNGNTNQNPDPNQGQENNGNTNQNPDPNQGQENNGNTNQNPDPNQGQENNGNTNQNSDTNQGQENNTNTNTNQNQNQNQNQEPATNNSIPTQTNNSQNNNYNMNTKENIQTTEQIRLPETGEKTTQTTKEYSNTSVIDKTTSSAEKLPQTGDNSIIVGCIVILSMISAFGIYKVRKNKYE